MTARFDAAVVGGGPAGATVALCLARRGWKVCLFEATRFDGDRYGETLPPEINPLLRELGVFDEFRALEPLESPGMLSIWGGPPTEQDYLLNRHGSGWHVDRNRFDQMLCRQAANAGAGWFEGCRVDVAGRDGRWWCIGSIEARVLVDASGRNGLRIGRSDGSIDPCLRETEDRLLAIALRLVHPQGAPPDQRTFVETAPDGWWYSAPLPQGEVIAMFFTDSGVYAKDGIILQEQLSHAPFTQSRLLGAEVAGTRTLYASSSCRTTIAGEAWLAAGDSASSYDPISGLGIHKALRQATNAAIAVDGFLRGETKLLAEYAALVRREFDAYVRRRQAHYAAERRWQGKEFWHKRAGIDKTVPDLSTRPALSPTRGGDSIDM
jgi:flavin-dependent dehydrogenase